MAQPKLRKEIHSDLLKQLSANGTHGKHFVDMLSDYMKMWDLKNKLIEDIEARGVTIQYQHGAGQHGYKRNDSIAELNKTNATMLKLLDQLQIKANAGKVDDTDVEL